MAVTYLRLFDPTQQFQLKNGAINVAGLLKVKLEGTDDWAPVFDENGTQLQQPVILDNNGRSKGLFVDASKVYWLEVDDRDGYELFTIRKMTPCGGGAGSSLGGSYDVQSTDGTVNVTRYDNGGTVTFDLSIATQSEESKWGATFGTVASVTGDGTWEQVPAWTSAGSVAWNNGWEATKDCVADIAASLEMTSGDSDAITTIDVMCSFSVDGTVVSTEYGMLDPSENTGRVTFEYKGALAEGQKVDCRFSVKGDEAMTPVLVGRAYYNEECDGIVGGENQGTTYIPGAYVEITTADVINVTGLQPLSGMSAYAFQSSLDDCCSGMSSVVSSIQNDVSSISSVVSGITGATGNYVEKSSISAESATWNTVSSKVDQSAFDDCCSSMSGYVSSLQNDVSSISSTVSGLTGQYVEISAISGQSGIWNEVSGKLDNSASSTFYPMTGNPSGFALSSDISSMVSAVSSNSATWNSASAISSKLDESAFTAYTSTATGFFTGVVTDSSLTGDGTPGSALGVNRMELVFDSSMETSVDGNSAIVGVNTAIMSGYMPTGASSDFILTSQSGMFQPSGNYQPSGDYLSSTDSSNFIQTSQSGMFQPSGNYASSSDLTGFVYASSISAESAVWNSASAVSGKLDETAFTSYTATATGFFTGVSTDSSLTGNGTTGSALGVNRMELVFDTSMATSVSDGSATVGVNTAILSGKLDASAISSYALSADVSSCIDTVSSNSASWGGGATGDYVEKSAIEVTIGDSNTASNTAFAQGSANSAEQYSLVQGYGNSALLCSMAQGYDTMASARSIAQGSQSTAYNNSLAQGLWNSAAYYSFAQGGRISASGSSMAQGYYNSAFNVSFAQGMYLSAVNTAAVFGVSNLRGNGDTATGDSAAFVIGDGWLSSTGRHDLMVVTKDGEITMYSSTADTAGTGIMSSIRAISAAATGATQVVTATGSGIISGTGISSLNGSSIIAQSLWNNGRIMIGSGDPGMYLTGTHGTAYYKANELIINRSGYGEQVKFNLGSAGSQVYGSASGTRGAFIQMNNDSHTAFLGALSGKDGILELDGYSANSASMSAWDSTYNTVSSNSASWGAGASEATVSSIASSYAESAVSSVSGNYAQSADVSATVDLVTSQSANWGGSALQLSAGPGVKLEKSGSVLVASTDETVLWSGSSNMSSNPTIVLSEPVWNFGRLDVYALPHNTNNIPVMMSFDSHALTSNNYGSITIQAHAGGGGIRLNNGLLRINGSGNLVITETQQFSIIGTSVSTAVAASQFTMVVGINRTASN